VDVREITFRSAILDKRAPAPCLLRVEVERIEPILRVTHDSDNHSWRFLDSSDGTIENAKKTLSLQLVFAKPEVDIANPGGSR
jgi:hypothetical protein